LKTEHNQYRLTFVVVVSFSPLSEKTKIERLFSLYSAALLPIDSLDLYVPLSTPERKLLEREESLNSTASPSFPFSLFPLLVSLVSSQERHTSSIRHSLHPLDYRSSSPTPPVSLACPRLHLISPRILYVPSPLSAAASRFTAFSNI
jgi:hypothetical protein